ncbi:MAG TPA: acyl-CoA dehydrogenase family protein [Xanthobacteraceae bacterium]|nr:acyl-CoA dehydrogenase family protein [Xanthobacteraceae bacterium]
MDFAFTDEQRLLKDSIERLLADRYAFEARQRFMKEPEGWSRALWRSYAELGLLGLPFEEKHGGVSGGPVETMIVMEAFGRALALEPFFATVVLGGGLLRLGANETMRAVLIPKIAAGDLLLAFAHAERQSRYDLADVATTARRDGAGYVLDGTKSLVIHGDCADKLIVSARLAGARRDRGGIALFVVDADATGVSHRGYATVDGLRAAEITLSDVRVEAGRVLGEPGKAFPLLAQVVDAAIAALAAEAVGAMAAMHEITVEYLKTRKQFGVPIGNFQVLQHRAADMLIALEQARSMALFAIMMAEEPDPTERRKAMAATKVQIGRSARLVGQQAIQLHGGIGMTMEYKVGHYFKRVTAIDMLLGDADHQLAELARLGGLISAA